VTHPDRLRFSRSLGFALEGLSYTARTQPNWRIHLAFAAAAIAAGLSVGLAPVELAVLALTIGFVLAAEAANTALEAAVDAIGVHSLPAKHAKDAAAGAVLVAALTSVLVGLALFVPRLVPLLIGTFPRSG